MSFSKRELIHRLAVHELEPKCSSIKLHTIPRKDNTDDDKWLDKWMNIINTYHPCNTANGNESKFYLRRNDVRWPDKKQQISWEAVWKKLETHTVKRWYHAFRAGTTICELNPNDESNLEDVILQPTPNKFMENPPSISIRSQPLADVMVPPPLPPRKRKYSDPQLNFATTMVPKSKRRRTDYVIVLKWCVLTDCDAEAEEGVAKISPDRHNLSFVLPKNATDITIDRGTRESVVSSPPL